MLRRRLAVAAATAVGLAAMLLPADAAPGVRKLYLANNGGCGTAGANYVLLMAPTDGGECSGSVAGTGGAGYLADQTYVSVKSAAFRLDASRPLTGTIWVQHVPPVSTGGETAGLPGFARINFVVKADNTTIGTVKLDGAIPPGEGAKVPVNLKLPAALNGKTVKRFTVVADFDTAVGLTAISYSAPRQSFIAVPTK